MSLIAGAKNTVLDFNLRVLLQLLDATSTYKQELDTCKALALEQGYSWR